MKKFAQHSVLVIVDAQPKELGLPTEAYIEVEEVHEASFDGKNFNFQGDPTLKWLFKDGTPPVRTFEHVPSEMGAEEAEEVGVEHLLRY